jgi:hypothetical protein
MEFAKSSLRKAGTRLPYVSVPCYVYYDLSLCVSGSLYLGYGMLFLGRFSATIGLVEGTSALEFIVVDPRLQKRLESQTPEPVQSLLNKYLRQFLVDLYLDPHFFTFVGASIFHILNLFHSFPIVGADMNIKKRFSTKQQQLHRLQEGVSFGDGEEYNPGEYQRMASKFTKEYKAKNYPEHDQVKEQHNGVEESKRKLFCTENLEKDYWSIVETRSREISVEYGNDVNTDEFGSGFPLSERGRSVFGTTGPEKVKLPEPKFGTEEYYKETHWNTNNMPWAPDSVLRHVKVAINGINVPWMYYGSLFTTFCWHNEDNYLYSVNYHHKGAPKQVCYSFGHGFSWLLLYFITISYHHLLVAFFHTIVVRCPRNEKRCRWTRKGVQELSVNENEGCTRSAAPYYHHVQSSPIAECRSPDLQTASIPRGIRSDFPPRISWRFFDGSKHWRSC